MREEWADIPRGARAVDKARVKAYLGLPDASAAKAAKTKGMSLDDVAELIRTNGWREPRELYRFAEDSRVEAPALYEAVLRLGRAKLSELVSVVSEMSGNLAEPEADRVAKLQYAARASACTCDGRWIAAAERLCDIQGLDSLKFRACVVRAPRWGRNKTINPLIVGEPDGGKSFLFKPLAKIFTSMVRKGQKDTFALQGVHGKEVCVLQDVRHRLGHCAGRLSQRS